MASLHKIEDLIVTFAGQRLTGWADGQDVVSIEPGSDTAGVKIGADGRGVIMLYSDKSGSATLKFGQGAEAIAFLDAQIELGAAGIGEFQVVDPNDANVKIMAERAVVTARPKIGWGKEASEREFKIMWPRATMKAGGAPDA